MTNEQLNAVMQMLQSENANMPLLFKELKIGLDDQDRANIIKKVLETLGSNVYSESEILALTENKGLLVAKDTGSWYFWNEKLERPNKYEFGGTIEDTAAINELKASKRENLTIYSNKDTEFADAMAKVNDLKEFYTYFYDLRKTTNDSWQLELDSYPNIVTALSIPTSTTASALLINRVGTEAGGYFLDLYLTNNGHSILYKNTIGGWLTGCAIGEWHNLKQTKTSTTAEANTVAVRQADGALFAVTNPTPDDMELINAKHLKQYVLENKTDAFDLDQMVAKATKPFDPLNPVEHTIVTDLAEDNQHIEIHLDKMFLDTLSVETKLTTKIPRGNHAFGLDRLELTKLKGIRIWINFEYNGTYNAYLHQDIYFPKISTVNPSYFGTPIPNPYIFSEKIIPVVDTTANSLEVKLISTGGSIDQNDQKIKIVDVIGLL